MYLSRCGVHSIFGSAQVLEKIYSATKKIAEIHFDMKPLKRIIL